MKHRYTFIYAVLTASALLIGCQKDTQAPTQQDSSDVIFFSPHLSACGATRGSMITGTEYDYSKLGAFWVAAWDFDSNVRQFSYTKADTLIHSEGSGHTYWSTVDSSDEMVEYLWKENVTKRFFAYTNLPATSGAAVMTNTDKFQQYLEYNVSKVPDASDQTDILLGYYYGLGLTPADAGKTGTDWVGHFAPITFFHPLAAIRFKKGDGWTSGENFTQISIDGVYSSGKFIAKSYNSEDTRWKTRSGSTTVSMADISDTFFLIGQTLSEKSVTITVTATETGTKSCTVSSGTWVAGKCYTYSLDVSSGHSLVVSTVSVSDMDSGFTSGSSDAIFD